jgi:hypothetical protein
MASQQTQEEMNMYDNCGLGYSDSDGEDENPEPKWNLQNWKGNSSAPTVCGGCVKRITLTGDARGCEECDETWDMPDLVPPPRAYFDYEPIDSFIINKDSIDAPNRSNDIAADTGETRDMPDLVPHTRRFEECNETHDVPEICLTPIKWTSPLDFSSTYVGAYTGDICFTPVKGMSLQCSYVHSDAMEAEKTSQVVSSVGGNGAVYCEGCELFDAGLGGENQMGHACLGY